MQVAISLICIIFYGQYCLVSLIDQLLVKTRDMAFGPWKLLGHIRIVDDLTDCVVRSNIRLFSPMMFAGSFRVYLFNLKFYKLEYCINCYLRAYVSLIKNLSIDLCPLSTFCALYVQSHMSTVSVLLSNLVALPLVQPYEI